MPNGNDSEAYVVEKLLDSIETDSLAIFCGAGLSVPEPSGLPTAKEVAGTCEERYLKEFSGEIPKDAQGDLERIASFFRERNQFNQVFLSRLVPWGAFAGKPNGGHFTVADFILCRASKATVTTNIDDLIEKAASDLGEGEFYSSLSGSECNQDRGHAPLLKLHGCATRDRENTLWCADQLDDDAVRGRIETSKVWLLGHLRNRDAIFLGFWSDWAYLNQVLESSVNELEPRMVVVVDLADSSVLATKAGGLWKWANGGGFEFHHIKRCACDFLEHMRGEFTRRFLDKMMIRSVDEYELRTGELPPKESGFHWSLSHEDMYSLRRDACGAPRGRPAKQKGPDHTMGAVGVALLFLKSRGAVANGPAFVLKSSRIRVVNGAGRLVCQMAKLYQDEPNDPEPVDIFVCAGAEPDGGVPGDIARGPRPTGVVRKGKTSRWLTLPEAVNELRG